MKPMTVSRLYYHHTVLKKPLSKLAEENGMSKIQVYRALLPYREYRGEVMLSREWMVARINEGLCPKQMADMAMCCLRTVYYKAEKYDIRLPRRNNPQDRVFTK